MKAAPGWGGATRAWVRELSRPSLPFHLPFSKGKLWPSQHARPPEAPQAAPHLDVPESGPQRMCRSGPLESQPQPAFQGRCAACSPQHCRLLPPSPSTGAHLATLPSQDSARSCMSDISNRVGPVKWRPTHQGNAATQTAVDRSFLFTTCSFRQRNALPLLGPHIGTHVTRHAHSTGCWLAHAYSTCTHPTLVDPAQCCTFCDNSTLSPQECALSTPPPLVP